MKTILTSAIGALLLCSALALESCKKKDDVAPLTKNIQRLVPQNVIDTLRILGMDIIETGKPVQITGIYEMKSPILIGSNLANDKLGKVYRSTNVQFLDQNDNDQSIKLNFKSGAETGSGIGGFIAGSGNRFTAFFETKAQEGSATSTSAEVYSGEWTANGIKDLKSAFYIKDKKDPDNILVKVGTVRVFKDGDGLSPKIAALRLSAENEELTTTADLWRGGRRR